VAAGAFAPGTHVQLVEGNIVEMTPQSSAHAMATCAVEEALRSAFPTGHNIRVQMPLGLGPAAEPEPDVAVVRGSFRDYRDHHPEHAVLIVEVADTTLTFDRSRKAEMYARHGVPEYWLLNLVDRQLEVFRQATVTGYVSQQIFAAGDAVSPLSTPQARLPVSSLLP